jgi:hypothetical protein
VRQNDRGDARYIVTETIETIRTRFITADDVRAFYAGYYHDGLPVNERHVEQTCANYGIKYVVPLDVIRYPATEFEAFWMEAQG